MRRAITFADVGTLLQDRDQLRERGMSDRDIASAVAQDSLHRVRRGWFVATAQWRQLWPEGRHLVHVATVARDARRSRPVFSHVSAAVLFGLPLYRYEPSRVEVRVANPRHVASVRDVLRHEGTLPDADVVDVHGLRVTSLARTVVDLARSLRLEAAVSVADAALRKVAVTDHVQNETLAESWRGQVEMRLAAARGQRGIRQARWVTEFADGRAQLPGESVSRLQFHRLGVRHIDLQVPVEAPGGGFYWIDFGFDDWNAFGEFDGEEKYLNEAMRSGKSLEQVLLEEKHREDWIRGRTGRRVLRWGAADVASSSALARRLAAFNFVLPG